MSFHNKQGMDNILPIAEKLCEDKKIKLLYSTYGLHIRSFLQILKFLKIF